MPKTYNNVPMSDDAIERVEQQDAFWSGPKLIVLSVIVLGGAFALLWASAEGIIGPSYQEVDWGRDTHLLQGVAPDRSRPWD